VQSRAWTARPLRARVTADADGLPRPAEKPPVRTRCDPTRNGGPYPEKTVNAHGASDSESETAHGSMHSPRATHVPHTKAIQGNSR
jgi:hypothetical protein